MKIGQETGILIISKKLEAKLKHLKPQINKSIVINITNCKSVDFLDLNGKNKRKTSIIKKTIIDDKVSSNSIDDPLGKIKKYLKFFHGRSYRINLLNLMFLRGHLAPYF